MPRRSTAHDCPGADASHNGWHFDQIHSVPTPPLGCAVQTSPRFFWHVDCVQSHCASTAGDWGTSFRLCTDWVMFIPPWCPRPPSQLQLWTPEDFAHVRFGKVRVGAVSGGVVASRAGQGTYVNSNLPLTTQAILFFQCKVSASRHDTGQYRLKHVAFVEELWTFKPSSRRHDILTSEFDVKRLYRTKPDATFYCIDVWRIIGDAC